MENQLQKTDGNFQTAGSFEHAQRVAKMFMQSSLIPAQYQNNMPNTMIAMEMANRIGANPLMVMQNLYIVQGKPSWSSTFIIAALNACKRFSPLRFDVSGSGKELTCRAWAYDVETKERLEGPLVTMEMAEKEGWLNKAGSKWKTMPELMIRYRSAAFFGRLYAPEILMGLHTQDEIIDITPVTIDETKLNAEHERITAFINSATDVNQLKELDGIELTAQQTELFETKKTELNGKV